jgi:chromosome segregation ATPase
MIQASDTFFSTPIRISSQSFTTDAHFDCVSMISQTLDELTKSSGILAMTPRQSSDSSVVLTSHVEVLCHVVKMLQDNVKTGAKKLKEKENLIEILEPQIQELHAKLKSLPDRETFDQVNQAMASLDVEHKALRAKVLDSKVEIQELEQTCKNHVSSIVECVI